MWDGVFSPTFTKHHMKAVIGEKEDVDVNPINEEPLPEVRPYYRVEVRWPPETKTYTYLIAAEIIEKVVAESDADSLDDLQGRELNEKDVLAILEEIKTYTKNPIDGGRHIEFYIAEEES